MLLNAIGAVLFVFAVLFALAGWPYAAGACAGIAVVAAVALAWRWRWRP
jgi:hypothetical protein